MAALTGTIGGGSYDVFQLGSAGANGAAVPGVDYTNTGIDLAAAGGTLFIAKKTAGYDVGHRRLRDRPVRRRPGRLGLQQRLRRDTAADVVDA